jgi:hypothetical protein
MSAISVKFKLIPNILKPVNIRKGHSLGVK